MGHVQSIVHRIESKYSPDSHDEAESAVEEFFNQSETDEVVNFGTFNGVYPIAIVGPPLPNEEFEETDNLFVVTEILDDYATGAYRFEIIAEEIDWRAIIEIPDSYQEQVKNRNFEIHLPTKLNGIRRFLRLQTDSNKLDYRSGF
jgi:hypothetical protein